MNQQKKTVALAFLCRFVHNKYATGSLDETKNDKLQVFEGLELTGPGLTEFRRHRINWDESCNFECDQSDTAWLDLIMGVEID